MSLSRFSAWKTPNLKTFSNVTFSVNSSLTHPGRVKVSCLAAWSPLSQIVLGCAVLSPHVLTNHRDRAVRLMCAQEIIVK